MNTTSTPCRYILCGNKKRSPPQPSSAMAPSSAAKAILAGLHHLTKAPNKACVLKAFNRVFMMRDEIGGGGGADKSASGGAGGLPSSSSSASYLLPVFLEEMSLKEDESKELYDAMSHIISMALYDNEVKVEARHVCI